MCGFTAVLRLGDRFPDLTPFADIHELRPGYVLTFIPVNESHQSRRFFDIVYEVGHSMSEKVHLASIKRNTQGKGRYG